MKPNLPEGPFRRAAAACVDEGARIFPLCERCARVIYLLDDKLSECAWRYRFVHEQCPTGLIERAARKPTRVTVELPQAPKMYARATAQSNALEALRWWSRRNAEFTIATLAARAKALEL